MKEIDTESTVIWPAWCYSGNIPTDILKQTPATATTAFVDVKTDIPLLTKNKRATTASSPITFTTRSDCSNKDYTLEISNETYQNGDNNVPHKSPSPITATASSTTAATTTAIATSPQLPPATIKRNIKSTNKTLRQQQKLTKSACNDFSQHSSRQSPTKSPSQEATTALNTSPASFTAVVAAAAEKMLSERSMLLNRFNALNAGSIKNHTIVANTTLMSGDNGVTVTATPTHSNTAAAYLYLEKLKNEKLATNLTAAQLDSLKETIMESAAISHNSSNNNNNNNNNNSILSNNNNLLISHVQNNALSTVSGGGGVNSCITGNQQQQNHCSSTSSNSSNSSSGIGGGVKRERLSPGGINGELQSKLARSRSTTPSSFRGTSSPQQALHNSSPDTLIPMHNLSTNLLNSLQQAASSASRQHQANANLSNSSASAMPTDFSARNYSDIMRSLAAKYNNSHANDTLSRRNPFFDSSASCSNSSSHAANNSKLSNPINKSNSSNPTTLPSSLTIKELASSTAAAMASAMGHATQHQPASSTASLPPPATVLPPPPPALSPNYAVAATLKSQNAQNQIAAAAAEAGVSPFMTSFLCSLPFVQSVFPPLIDMSSTQALLTLARAAKEAEIQSILGTVRNPKRPNSSASSSPRPNLSAALQQAAQFVSPTFIYSAQMQQAQLQQQQQQQQQQQSLTRPASRQPSPRTTTKTTTTFNNSTTASGTSANEHAIVASNVTAAPLDLSSQPPAAKRFKAESTSRRVSSTSLQSVHSPSPSSPPSAVQVEGNPLNTKATEATSVTSTKSNLSNTNSRQCQAQSEEVNSWTVDEVCTFVGGIDICAEYVQHFRDQCIDGSGLPLLTEDHLVNSLGMKLGPALKLRSMLAKKLGGPCPCVACVAQTQQILALQAAAAAAAQSEKSSSYNETTSTEATTTSAGAVANISIKADQQQQQQQSHGVSNVTATTAPFCGGYGKSDCNEQQHQQQQQQEQQQPTDNNQSCATKTAATSTPSVACNNINNNDSNKPNNSNSNTSNNNNNNSKGSCNVSSNIANNSIVRSNNNNNNDNNNDCLLGIGHGRRGRSSSSNSSHSSHWDVKRPPSADSTGDGS